MKKPDWEDEYKDIFTTKKKIDYEDFYLAADEYDRMKGDYLKGIKNWEPQAITKKEANRELKKMYKNKYDKGRLTAEDRLRFKREREALVGSLITQEGPLCGGLVKEHVKGSQYLVLLVDGTTVSASHKKRTEDRPGLSQGGWNLWEDRS